MELNQEIVNRLTDLRKKKKFTDSDWEKRGLNPSDSNKINEMVQLTDLCLDELLTDIQNNPTEKKLKNTLTKGLKRFKTSHYDTEEKEFIADEFQKISSVLGLNLAGNLNGWLYGKVLGTIINLTKKKETIFDTKEYNCTNCNLALKLKLTEIRNGIPNYWVIGQCNQCGEFNLLSTGENAGRLDFENFTSTEMLDSNENSEERANTRLNQLKYFRGRK